MRSSCSATFMPMHVCLKVFFSVPTWILLALLSTPLTHVAVAQEEQAQTPIDPLLRTVDLNLDETVDVTLSDGSVATVRVVSLDEQRDPLRNAVRKAVVVVEVNGEQIELVSGNYRLPQRIGDVQIDCPVTSGYYRNRMQDSWGLEKAVRLRLWPGDSPWIEQDSFCLPARQKWFASHTQMSNEPVYVDLAESLTSKTTYYHSGLDIGGSEGDIEIVAATDGLVITAGGQVLEQYRRDLPMKYRNDVVHILDGRGWVHYYSHLISIDPKIVPGRTVSKGERLGLLGKEGNSGGWSHLHYEIKSRQPSGKWGTQDGYAFLWQAHLQQNRPDVVAVARPHQLIRTGETALLDGSRSWAADGDIASFHWTFCDGQTAEGAQVARVYDKPGAYSEILEIQDNQGRRSYDFAIVHVYDPAVPTKHTPITLQPTFSPTTGIQPGQEVTFKVRSFTPGEGKERWNFGDGSPEIEVQSDGNVERHAPDGFAVARHRFDQSGDYLVRVERWHQGVPAYGHLHVRVDPGNP